MTLSVLSPPHPYHQQAPTMHGYGAPPQPPHPRAYIGSSAPRYGMTHGQNSAHSPSANPDEDWTKISDLAERRRIQNRIAQRNYRERKKLKRRLEDLERRASPSSPPPGSNSQLAHEEPGARRKSGTMPTKRSPNPNNGGFQASPGARDYNSLYPTGRDGRQPSITPPPSMTHSNHSNGSATTSPNMPSIYQPHPSGYQPAQPPYYQAPYADSAYPSMPQPILPPPAGLGLSRLPDQPDTWNSPKPYANEEMFGQFGMGGQYPASTTAAPYDNNVAGVTTGYPEQGIYSTHPMYG